MNWMNIRPCLKLKNAQKHNKIEPWLSVCQEIKAKKFLNEKNNFQIPNQYSNGILFQHRDRPQESQ
jgi:hypothetical protein